MVSTCSLDGTRDGGKKEERKIGCEETNEEGRKEKKKICTADVNNVNKRDKETESGGRAQAAAPVCEL